MILKTPLFILLIFCQLNIFSQNNLVVSNITEYNNAIKTALPGTTIILKNGTWRDLTLNAYGKGEKENPITIKAETPGEVIITGKSKLNIYGEYLIVEGLWFKDGQPFENGSIISFKKNSEQYAINCRFTNNTISYFNPTNRSVKSHYISLWGRNNRIDHNNITGKNNLGSTLVVRLKGKEHTENNHLIDHNYFGPRPELGRNGGETIRIGTSTYSMESSKTTVESNTFEKCDGDLEIISNKSGDNIYRNNLFIASMGALTLRHGTNALVEKNVFLGKSKAKTGGVRISDQGHIVKNNLFVGLKGTSNSSPIAVMYGVPNSPLKRYKQVKNVSIQNNTLINCSTVDFATSKDKEKTLAPIQTLFANNLISNTDGTHVLDPADDISGIFFKSNIAETSANIDTNIFTKATIDWKLLKSLPMPTSNNKGLISTYTNATTPQKDINGMDRDPVIVGAFNFDNTKLPKALTLKSGPSWKPDIIVKNESAQTIIVEPGNNTLYQAIKEAPSNSIFQLKDGEYFFDKTRKLDGNVTIIGNRKTIFKSIKIVEKPFKSFFKINENASLYIKNIIFDGENNHIKYAIVSPSKDKQGTYNLLVKNCIFKNFNDVKGAIIRGYTNTLAEKIIIRNSTFIDSYRALNFHSSKNIEGSVNANLIEIDNCIFKNLDNYAINYKTNGNLLPAKGKLLITNSIFSKIGNSEKGKIIAAQNIATTDIKLSVFENCSSIVNTINLSGKNNNIANCLISNAGKVKNTKGATAKNILYNTPKWSDKKRFVPGKKSILLKKNNNVVNIGLKR